MLIRAEPGETSEDAGTRRLLGLQPERRDVRLRAHFLSPPLDTLTFPRRGPRLCAEHEVIHQQPASCPDSGHRPALGEDERKSLPFARGKLIQVTESPPGSNLFTAPLYVRAAHQLSLIT